MRVCAVSSLRPYLGEDLMRATASLNALKPTQWKSPCPTQEQQSQQKQRPMGRPLTTDNIT
mgnify:CR=1 FL=1